MGSGQDDHGLAAQQDRAAAEELQHNRQQLVSLTRCIYLLLLCPDRVVLVEDGALPRILVLLRLRPADDLVSTPHPAI